MAQWFVGTSGWTYASWRGTFYPKDLPSRRFLEFYAREFATTEVNYSFYRLPKVETYTNWAGQVSEEFLFAVKTSRLITHVKRLLDVEEAWHAFVQSALALGSRLGPLLLQFPPSFKQDRRRLATFLDMVRGVSSANPPLQLVFEFRHESWFTEEIYRLLKRHHAALCCADSPRYPRRDVSTTDFMYFRFHGRSQLFASRYTEAELRNEARNMTRYLRDGLDVYAYFNNDAEGHAVANARTLRTLLDQ